MTGQHAHPAHLAEALRSRGVVEITMEGANGRHNLMDADLHLSSEGGQFDTLHLPYSELVGNLLYLFLILAVI